MLYPLTKDVSTQKYPLLFRNVALFVLVLKLFPFNAKYENDVLLCTLLYNEWPFSTTRRPKLFFPACFYAVVRYDQIE